MGDYGQRFSGIGRLYGLSAMEKIKGAHVCVVGIGGVGSWAVEALSRSGVGTITMIDLDDVCVTNTNRQLHAMEGHVGRPKVAVMAERAMRINPDGEVHPLTDFFTASSAEALIDTRFDCVLDAIDQLNNKCLLLERCRTLGVPIVTVGGAGGRRDPSRVTYADLNRSDGDRLLHKVRKRLRQKHDFPRGRGKWGIPCVFSNEPALFPTPEGGVCETPTPGVGLRLDCESGFGTASFVTGTFGFMAASLVIDQVVASES